MADKAAGTSKPKLEESATATAAGSAAQSNPAIEAVDDVPDPDEDDLDDLDDMLDEFSAVNLTAPKPEVPAAAAATAGPARPPQAAVADEAADPVPGLEDFDPDNFAKQLQAGMADLIGELEKDPEARADFENFFGQLSDGTNVHQKERDAEAAAAAATPGPSTAPAGGPAGPPAGGADFQETIRRTMERMQSSGEQATAAASSGGEEDLLAELMKQMQGAAGGAGEGGEEDFSKMLLGMMEQLTNKEILYEPMKELHDKFPDWIAKNKDKTPAEDLQRYEEQQVLVKEIVAKFEEPTYADSNAPDREFIVDRMQKMQAAGSPPSDLVGDMPSAQDAFAGPDESCNPQ